MKFNISFKNYEKQTGLARVCAPDGCYIKVNKKEVGYIQGRGRDSDGLYRVCVQVIDTKESRGWKWVRFKIAFDTMEEAKEYVKSNLQKLNDINPLYFNE